MTLHEFYLDGNAYPKSTHLPIRGMNELLITIDPDNLPDLPQLDIFDMAERVEYDAAFDAALAHQLWRDWRGLEDAPQDGEQAMLEDWG